MLYYDASCAACCRQKFLLLVLFVVGCGPIGGGTAPNNRTGLAPDFSKNCHGTACSGASSSQLTTPALSPSPSTASPSEDLSALPDNQKQSCDMADQTEQQLCRECRDNRKGRWFGLVNRECVCAVAGEGEKQLCIAAVEQTPAGGATPAVSDPSPDPAVANPPVPTTTPAPAPAPVDVPEEEPANQAPKPPADNGQCKVAFDGMFVTGTTKSCQCPGATCLGWDGDKSCCRTSDSTTLPGTGGSAGDDGGDGDTCPSQQDDDPTKWCTCNGYDGYDPGRGGNDCYCTGNRTYRNGKCSAPAGGGGGCFFFSTQAQCVF